MTTDTVIDRASIKKGLLDLYLSGATVGGNFDARRAGENTAIIGLESPYGYTQKSRNLTIEPGFTVRLQGENFKDSVLQNDSSTIFKVGFNNKKYTDGSFSR